MKMKDLHIVVLAVFAAYVAHGAMLLECDGSVTGKAESAEKEAMTLIMNRMVRK